MEGADSLESAILQVLARADWHAHMTPLGVHHAVDTLSIDNESDADASANRDVAERLFDALVVSRLRLNKLKHRRHIYVCVEEHSLLAFLRREAQAVHQLL